MILMDVQMPVMNGVEATKMIRSQDSEVRSRTLERAHLPLRFQVSALSIPASQHSRIPVIALTAHAMTGDREKFLEAGMNDYLAKPVRMEDLKKLLERIVR